MQLSHLFPYKPGAAFEASLGSLPYHEFLQSSMDPVAQNIMGMKTSRNFYWEMRGKCNPTANPEGTLWGFSNLHPGLLRRWAKIQQ
ncbi:hypothetical protein Y1Q_0021905 [Alligator mississippiensis]|uniref:Uncharacterized protein n=1 Tax=Alligator mississippiensis TaxID=8496 RepID=A0A151M659_ALLMI|nr:hypothetical protein Y1Q_0021905 [Alligator mississippiensis]